MLGAANLGDEVAHLLRDRQQALVLVVVAVGEERHELGPRSLRSQRRCDRGQAPDAVQTELDVLVLGVGCEWVVSVGGREAGNRGRGVVASRVGRGSRAADGRVFLPNEWAKTPSVTFCRRVAPGRTTSARRDASEDVERTLSSSMSIATEKRSSLLSDAMVPQRRTRGASFSDGGPGGDRSRPFEVATKVVVDRPFSLVGEREKVGTAGVVRKATLMTTYLSRCDSNRDATNTPGWTCRPGPRP